MASFLSTSQRKRLQAQLRHTHDVRVFRRTFAVLEVDRGRPLRELATALGVSRQSIYNWVEEFKRECDPAVLFDAARSGRPAVWTGNLLRLLEEALQTRPELMGFGANQWTVPLLLAYLEREGGFRPSVSGLRQKLHQLRYTWKRYRYVLEPDPEYDKKKTNSEKTA